MTTSTTSKTAVVPVLSVWRPALLALAAVLAVILLAYGSTAADMVQTWWRSNTFTHGFFIVPIVAFLIWQQREAVARLNPRPAPWVLVLMLLVSVVWLGARVLGINAAEQFAFVALVPLGTMALLGVAITRVLLFPLAYLFFAVPFGEFLVPVLQDITAAFTVWALNVSRIPVLWEGRYFFIPTGSFEVAEACSGVRYLIASVALGALYAWWSYYSPWRRLAFIALAVVVPVLANGVRAYLIVMIAHLSDNQLAVGIDHFIYGWFFFGLVMMLIFWIGNRFRDEPPVVVGAPAQSAVAGKPAHWMLWSAAAVVVIAAAPLLQQVQQAPGGPAAELQLPAGRDGWRGPLSSVDAWAPKYPEASSTQRAEYRFDLRAVQVYAAWYANPSRDTELGGPENALHDHDRERRVGESEVEVAGTGGRRWTARELQLQTPAGMRIVWTWYVVGGREVTGVIRAKWIQARARLTGGDSSAGVVALAADYDTDPEQARALLRTFVTAHDLTPAVLLEVVP